MLEKFNADDKVEDYAAAPSYDDDTTTMTPPPPFSSCKDHPARPSFPSTQVAESRTRRIQNLLATAIEPLLYPQLLDGIIYQKAVVVVPSDILTQQPRLLAKDIVAPPNAGEVSVVRLEGDENRAAFWHRPGVPQELASCLRTRLAASGYTVEPALETGPAAVAVAVAVADTAPAAAPSPQQRQQQQVSSSWMKKKFGTPGPMHDPTASINYKLGWRSEEEDQPRRKLRPDELRVSVKVRDVSFRVETEMGLLDSVTGRVLWLELEVGI